MASASQHLANGAVERWHLQSIPLVVDRSIALPAFTGLDAIARVSATTWNNAAETTPNAPRLAVETGDAGEPGFDPAANARNVSGVYLAPDGLREAASNALAVTIVTYDANSGEILDSDVLFNTRDHVFATFAPAGAVASGTSSYDIENTLTHEFGHVLGLGEDPAHVGATMFPSSAPGEVAKRDLDPADLASLAESYASASTAPDEAPRGCGGSHVAATPRVADAVVVLAVIAMASCAFATRRKLLGLGLLALSWTSLTAATPLVTPTHHSAATITAVRPAWSGRFIRSRVTVREADGREHDVTVLGGRVGNVVMRVYGAPDGAALTPGMISPLPPR